MSDDESEDETGFKVKDRRRFDSKGNVRDDEDDVGTVTSDSAEASAGVQESPPGDGGQAGPSSEINFGAFIMSLATQALMQLGEMKPPPGVEIEVDLNSARQTIDILRILEKKTEGNLEEAEQHLLGEILNTLKVSFVKASSG